MVALKADKNKSPEVNELLKELGNSATAIPYYAIFSPGLDKPIHFGGNILTTGKVREVVQKGLDAGGDRKDAQRVASAATDTEGG